MKRYHWLRALAIISALSAFYLELRPPGSLLLTEVYYDTPGRDADREWVELANLGEETIDLSDYKLSDGAFAGSKEGAWRFPAGALIEPDQVIVVAQKASGFRQLFGQTPDFEISDTDPLVPDMRPYQLWASGDLALSNEGDEILLLDEQNLIQDAINYGDVSTFFSPSVAGVLTGQSIERMPATCDSDTAADWLAQPSPAPGVISRQGECRVPKSPADLGALPSIGEIQGVGVVSPYVNQLVNFRGVVTGSYEDRNSTGIIFYTLFVQDLPGHEDGDPATSDGIAIFLGRQKPLFQPGDQVNVTGLVTEYFGFTEIDDDELRIYQESSSAELPIPILLEMPVADQAAYLESLEGMLVALNGFVRVVGPTHTGCSFEVTLEESGRERILRQQSEDPVDHLLPILHDNDIRCEAFPQVKSGDHVGGIRGPLMYSFDQFRITQQESAALVVEPGPWPAQPDVVIPTESQFSVTTFNLENHFDANHDTGEDAEPVPSPAQVAAKQQKLVYAIQQILGCPTIIAVQEVENAGLLQELASEVGQVCGFAYEVSHQESPDARGIDLALLSDSRQVQVRLVRLRQSCTTLDTGIIDQTVECAAGDAPLFSRPPLEVSLEIDGRPYVFLVNHFKSKRGGGMETAARRLEQARFVAGLVAEYLGEGRETGIVVLGDFNDYERSPAVQTLVGSEGPLTSVLARLPDEERYSYIFSGVSQLPDGIYLSDLLLDSVVHVAILHVNADFPMGMAYDTTAVGLPYRSSDHDLPLLILDRKSEEILPLSPTATPVTVVTIADNDNEAVTVADNKNEAATVAAEPNRPVKTAVALVFAAFALVASLMLVAGLIWRARFKDKKI